MPNLIHVACFDGESGKQEWLFMRRLEPKKYAWFWEKESGEAPTGIEASDTEEALRLARREWKEKAFTPLACGYRFTLPERDEHGNNALFYQMVKSLASPSGVYFDDEYGYNAIVHQIPLKAKEVYEKLKQENRL
jgi:hypothetical protein